MKGYKNAEGSWTFTFNYTTAIWYSITQKGVPNVIELRQFLEDPEVIALFTNSNIISSIKFVDALVGGTKITKADAMKNSYEWEMTQPDGDALDNVPSDDDEDDDVDDPEQESQSVLDPEPEHEPEPPTPKKKKISAGAGPSREVSSPATASGKRRAR